MFRREQYRNRFGQRLWIVMGSCLVLALSSGCLGCVPNGVWLPDSSGYVYTAGKEGKQIMMVDIGRRQARVVVQNTGAATAVPAISPDGKQIAIAQHMVRPDEDNQVQVIVYDVAGKEVERSEKLSLDEKGSKEQQPKLHPEVYWAPQGDRLLLLAGNLPGIYDLKKKTLTKLPDLRPMIIGNSLSRPDGKGFLLGGGSIHFVSWNGEDRELKLTNFKLHDGRDQNLAAMILYPQIYNTRWDGDVALIRWSTRQVRIDTNKLEATLEEVAEQRTADRKPIQQTFALGKEGPFIRVAELVARNFEGKTEDRPDGGYGQFRVELIKRGEATPQVLVDQFEGCAQLLPSPNRKLVAIECGVSPLQKKTKPRRLIILVNAQGEVVAEIDGLKTH